MYIIINLMFDCQFHILTIMNLCDILYNEPVNTITHERDLCLMYGS